MRILVSSESYQNDDNGAVSYQLTDVRREGVEVCEGDSESVDL
jgi:hypothetical protein